MSLKTNENYRSVRLIDDEGPFFRDGKEVWVSRCGLEWLGPRSDLLPGNMHPAVFLTLLKAKLQARELRGFGAPAGAQNPAGGFGSIQSYGPGVAAQLVPLLSADREVWVNNTCIPVGDPAAIPLGMHLGVPLKTTHDLGSGSRSVFVGSCVECGPSGPPRPCPCPNEPKWLQVTMETLAFGLQTYYLKRLTKLGSAVHIYLGGPNFPGPINSMLPVRWRADVFTPRLGSAYPNVAQGEESLVYVMPCKNVFEDFLDGYYHNYFPSFRWGPVAEYAGLTSKGWGPFFQFEYQPLDPTYTFQAPDTTWRRGIDYNCDPFRSTLPEKQDISPLYFTSNPVTVEEASCDPCLGDPPNRTWSETLYLRIAANHDQSFLPFQTPFHYTAPLYNDPPDPIQKVDRSIVVPLTAVEELPPMHGRQAWNLDLGPGWESDWVRAYPQHPENYIECKFALSKPMVGPFIGGHGGCILFLNFRLRPLDPPSSPFVEGHSFALTAESAGPNDGMKSPFQFDPYEVYPSGINDYHDLNPVWLWYRGLQYFPTGTFSSYSPVADNFYIIDPAGTEGRNDRIRLAALERLMGLQPTSLPETLFYRVTQFGGQIWTGEIKFNWGAGPYNRFPFSTVTQLLNVTGNPCDGAPMDRRQMDFQTWSPHHRIVDTRPTVALWSQMDQCVNEPKMVIGLDVFRLELNANAARFLTLADYVSIDPFHVTATVASDRGGLYEVDITE